MTAELAEDDWAKVTAVNRVEPGVDAFAGKGL
jgi:hypothetical protein